MPADTSKPEYPHLGRPGSTIVDPPYIVYFKEKQWGLATAGPEEVLLGLQLDYGFKEPDFLAFVDTNSSEEVQIFYKDGHLLLKMSLESVKYLADTYPDFADYT